MTATTHHHAATGARPVRTRSGYRWLRVAARAVGIALATAVMLAVVGLPVYVFPADDKIVDSDLAYVIGPPTGDRVELAQKLLREGSVSRMLVVGYAPGNRDYEVSEMAICHDEAVTCIIPSPSTTKGEVVGLEHYAARHSVERTVVITVAPHVVRTRYIFDKCFGGEVDVVGVPGKFSLDEWVRQYIYQTAAFLKAWATPCADE